MEKLIELGIFDEELKNMYIENPVLCYLNDTEISNNILVLKQIGCSEQEIKNILIANPFYLNRSINDLQKLIKKLYSIGLTNLNLLFESNPFFLNKDLFEIEEFINIKEKEGLKIDEIVDLIDSNPYAIDEI